MYLFYIEQSLVRGAQFIEAGLNEALMKKKKTTQKTTTDQRKKMEQLSIVKVLEAQFGLDLMHQPIPPAPSPRPSPWADPRALAFFLPWMANSQEWGLLSCQIPRGGDKKDRKCPVLRQHCNIFH